MRYHFYALSFAAALLAVQSSFAAEATSPTANASTATKSDPSALTMIVMDPLALPLSCPCVQGYAQRDYDKLAAALKKELGREVKIVYHESLPTALQGKAEGKADIVIGKHSVVLFDGERTKQKLSPVAKLPGKDGATTMTGLIVVPAKDSAKSVADLKDYRIVFGPEECDEKHKAALALLKKNGVTAPSTLETSPACSDGACWILEDFQADEKKHGAAVISSYAKPLLEGCGTVEKGSLRVVGETEPVPFIEAFVNDKLSAADQSTIAKALVKVTAAPELRVALETKDGFTPMQKSDVSTASAKKK
jgi:ABC-type phosphate/phosphonate transport system substrate-binding protein